MVHYIGGDFVTVSFVVLCVSPHCRHQQTTKKNVIFMKVLLRG